MSCSNRRDIRRLKGVFEAVGEGWDDGDIAFLFRSENLVGDFA